MTSICRLYATGNGECIKEQIYTLPPKEALIAAVMQHEGNTNTWEYPETLDGIYESKLVKQAYYYDVSNELTMQSIPVG